MDVRGYPTCFRKALAISIVAALCSGMAVPATAMPNMPHLFAKHEVATCGGDVAHVSHPYRNSSRGYSDDAAACCASYLPLAHRAHLKFRNQMENQRMEPAFNQRRDFHQ